MVAGTGHFPLESRRWRAFRARLGARPLVVLAVILSPCLAAPASAEAMTGEVLYDWCSAPLDSPTNLAKSTGCRSYIDGVSASLAAFTAYSREDRVTAIRYCPPAGETSDQLRQLVVKELAGHAKGRAADAIGPVMSALVATFPCPEK